MRKIWFYTSVLFALIACNSEKKVAQSDFTNKINKPIPQFPESDFTFKVNNQKADTIEYSTGTRIIIPENTFVDEKGNAITDSVDITYNEYTSAGAIILSGIPMYIKQGDSVINFQTGGMFTIKATKDGKIVFVKEGKTVTVDMKTNYKGEYDFWKLDTNSEEVWQKLKSSNMVLQENTLHNKSEQLVKPTEPHKYDKNSDLAFDLGFNLKDFPELKSFKGLMWTYKGDMSRSQIKEIFGRSYDETKLVAYNTDKLEYKLTLKSPLFKEELIISPVFSGQNYKKALEAYNMQLKDYNKIVENTRYAESDMRMRRIFALNSMGTFNCDRFYGPNTKNLLVTVKINDQKLQNEISKAHFYHVTGDQLNAFIPIYLSGEQTSFRFNKDEPNFVIAVFPNQSVAIFGQKMFEQSGIKQATNFDMILDVMDKKLAKPGDLDKILLAGL